MIYDVIVIGGGPSGLMACNVFEQSKINYLLLEKNEKLGKKLLITGGKRCNITNNLSVVDFISALSIKHKRFLYSSLMEFGPVQIIDYFKKSGLNLILENDFKYFPETNKSSSVLEVLENNINKDRIMLNSFVKDISISESIFTVKTNNNLYKSKKVVIATGSSSYPSTGSNGDGLLFARNLGIEYTEFTPAETNVYSNYVTNNLSDLQGVSLINTVVKICGTKIANGGGLVFTHFGVSGPAILHSSEDIYKELLKGKVDISFNISESSKNEIDILFEEAKLENKHILKVLEILTTKKLAKKMLELSRVENKNINEISKKDLATVIDLLLNFTIEIDKVETKEKAFVNAGGILTKGLDPKSFESKIVNDLYFIGETVDVHGPIGGFNITIALSTGYNCAKNIIE